MNTMTQEAPYPVELEDLVSKLDYNGWKVTLEHRDRGQGSEGLTLIISAIVPDSYDPDRLIGVNHFFIVPAASYNRRSWEWWLFQRLLLLSQHETMENFIIDGERPFAPMHGPGNDPYLITVERAEVDRRTNFKGEVQE